MAFAGTFTINSLISHCAIDPCQHIHVPKSGNVEARAKTSGYGRE
jgi:hypothetical protein